jgi:D-aminopeptidase
MKGEAMTPNRALYACLLVAIAYSNAVDAFPERPRARELGIAVGKLEAGRRNAITDVPGVRVGNVTILEADSVRTGVTAVLPHGGNIFQEKVRAAIAVGNGFGKLVGLTQVRELGQIETPIVLTNTLSVFTAAEALVKYTLGLPGNQNVRSVNPVAGECNDGWLNDIRGFHVTTEHVLEAIGSATDGEVGEGGVGAGTGTRCLGYKGGIGSSSRLVDAGDVTYTVGVLVQTNYGGSLRVLGVPVGDVLSENAAAGDKSEGSCMIVLATDAPLSSRSLERLARRTFLGLARTGSVMSHGSGDYAIAFSTAYTISHNDEKGESGTALLRDDRLTPLFAAAVDATEEAVYNSMFKAFSLTGCEGHAAEGVPIQRMMNVLRSRGAVR